MKRYRQILISATATVMTAAMLLSAGALSACGGKEEAPQSSLIGTFSGDPGIGNVSIRVTYFNQWTDQYFAMRAKTIDVNGGNLYFSSMCRGGVLYTVNGSDFTFDNCDIVIEGGQDIGLSDGTNPSAINAQSGNEHITVTDATIAVFKNFVIGIAGWSGFTGEERVTLTVEGLLINDGYVTTIDSWDNTINIVGGDHIRYTNPITRK